MLSFSEVSLPGTPAQLRREGVTMKQIKDMNVCIAQLRALQCRNDIDPEQKQYVDEAIEQLKKLRRKSNPTRSEVFHFVRKVADCLLRAFVKSI